MGVTVTGATGLTLGINPDKSDIIRDLTQLTQVNEVAALRSLANVSDAEISALQNTYGTALAVRMFGVAGIDTLMAQSGGVDQQVTARGKFTVTGTEVEIGSTTATPLDSTITLKGGKQATTVIDGDMGRVNYVANTGDVNYYAAAGNTDFVSGKGHDLIHVLGGADTIYGAAGQATVTGDWNAPGSASGTAQFNGGSVKLRVIDGVTVQDVSNSTISGYGDDDFFGEHNPARYINTIDGGVSDSIYGGNGLFVESVNDSSIRGHAKLTVEGGVSDTIYGNSSLFVDSVSGSTIQGHAKLTVDGGASDTIYGNGSLLVDSVSGSTIQGHAQLTVDGGASDTIYGNGSLLVDSVSDSTVQGHAKLTVDGGASDTIYGKGNLLADSVSDSTIQAQAKLTVSGGSNDTISASHSTHLDDVDASTISVSVHGSLTFIDGSNGISDTVTGSYATIYGTAGLDLTANTGTTATYYASSGNETLDGGLSTGKLYARAGSGNDTLIGGSGYDTLRAGTGDDLFVAGSAQTEFDFIKGKAGGNDIIQDFGKSAGDVVKLSGYDAKTSSIQAMLDNATIAGGNTTVSLTDNTRITFVGVTDLKVQNFKS
ncbi:hypothetical protein BGC31_11995 [Komagataeibacter xylinus]|nr:putative hemolysin-type calcium-binding protein [Komagataeibacter xylinus E25]RFP00124.1 hypothetical protein BFX83_15035 [Komagataeibacter xylinus]RFP07094.1 hypothetical protein BGC31_11995 [Komagataeibacter xylinus]